MVGRQNLFLLRFGVATFWLKYTTFAAVLAHVLLATTRIMTISNDILAFAISTLVNNQFCYHTLTILHITST